MQKHPQLTTARIERFINNELRALLWQRSVPMAAAVHRPAPGLAPADAPGQAYTAIEPGFQWGPIWSDAWFRFSGTVPAEWAGEAVVARLDCGSEAIWWNGADPVQGVDGNHSECLLTESATAGAEFLLYVRANGMNPNVSCDAEPVDPPAEPFRFGHATLSVFDRELVSLFHDFRVAFGVMKEMPEATPRRGQLLYALNAAVNAFDPCDRSTWAVAAAIVAETFQRPATASAHHLSAVGHAHIDTAWLWPLERTQQKCLHTFATATRLMEMYPEYVFVCSQAQQYEWVKAMAPSLYERIREKAKTGQWEVVGSMWVEADCNVTGGESLVRQVLYGKRYWMKEFGIETRDLWLPDVFGYAASLPQILKKAGVDYFLTQKISWNQLNKFPHHTFLWQGIDGTRIFTHFPPADTYNGDMSPRELAYNVRNFRDHDRATSSLYVYGYGDGGGGPTVEMLENARRLADVEGMPTVTPETSSAFFKKAEEDAVDLPVWVGELYLELHRGTYTTQSQTKRGNRKSEFLLRDAEFLAAVSPAGLGQYPSEALYEAWKLVMVNQFHDIIPGSSVNEVYRDALADYAKVLSAGQQVVDTALAAIGNAVDTTGLACPVLAVRNYDHRTFGEPVIAPYAGPDDVKSVVYAGDQCGPAQIVDEDGTRAVIFTEATTEEGHGYTVYDLSTAPCEDVNTFTVTPSVLDNGLIRVELDETGQVTRVYDRLQNREVLATGETANQLQLFDDRPLYWDAWDIDVYYQETGRTVTELESIDVLEAGPVRGAVRITRKFGDSTVSQVIRLVRDRARVDFVTEVDWHESHKMLKAAFPIAVNAARATYEIQYGHVERPTHTNTSWDMARFEVAAQKWVDISEGDYGVAMLNDCKYGHDTVGSTLRLTLLRSPKAPDPEADMGVHRFTYSILPHYGDFRRGGVIEQAYHLNAPARGLCLEPGRPGSLPKEQVWFATSREGVVIESVKKAEDEQALIVRLYEAHNSRGPVQLRLGVPASRVWMCDLLERNEKEIAVVDGAVAFDIAPFEIVTLKVAP